jgi:hypothetical protein
MIFSKILTWFGKLCEPGTQYIMSNLPAHYLISGQQHTWRNADHRQQSGALSYPRANGLRLHLQMKLKGENVATY